MNSIKRYVFSSILFCAILIRCDYNSYENDTKTDCSTALCTMEFRLITVVIRHKNDSTLYQLTDYKVTRVSDNLDITPRHDNLSGYSGYYPVADDGDIQLFRNKNVEIEFKGFVNSSMVVQRRIIVSADCCHIFLAAGETKIYL
jgi:hypothetical protein